MKRRKLLLIHHSSFRVHHFPCYTRRLILPRGSVHLFDGSARPMKEDNNTDALTGTVKGPGERPHEYLFITADNARARIGEFVYYAARDGQAERRIIGNRTERRP